MAEKYKSIVIGASWSEADEEQYFVVPSDCDVLRMATDMQYATEQVVAQTETFEWANRIAAALSNSGAK